MKSKAPALIPWTAKSIVPHAVMRMHGTTGRKTLICLSSVKPSSPSVAREKLASPTFVATRPSESMLSWHSLLQKFMSISTSSTAEMLRMTCMASLGFSAKTTSYPLRSSTSFSESRMFLSSSTIRIMMNSVLCTCKDNGINRYLEIETAKRIQETFNFSFPLYFVMSLTTTFSPVSKPLMTSM